MRSSTSNMASHLFHCSFVAFFGGFLAFIMFYLKD